MTDAGDRRAPVRTNCRTPRAPSSSRELVDTFLDEAPTMLAELRGARAARRRRGASAAPRIR